MGTTMERLMPGLIVAGVAGMLGLSHDDLSQQNATDVSHTDSGIIQREAPSAIETASTHRGFVHAQNVVCEHVE